MLTVLRLFHLAAQLPTSAQSERENISEITSWLRAVSLYLSLGKYTCSGIVPALFNVCVCICINFLWNMWYDVFLLTCSLPPFCSCRLSHHSHFESESDFFSFVLFCFFVTAIWEINKCFCCLFLFSPPAHGFWGAMRSLNHNDNITAGMMTRGSYCENSLNKLLCPLFLLSGYECSYDLSFWYLGWVFLQCKLPRNISVFAGCCFFL